MSHSRGSHGGYQSFTLSSGHENFWWILLDMTLLCIVLVALFILAVGTYRTITAQRLRNRG